MALSVHNSRNFLKFVVNMSTYTVNSEIIAIILFSRIVLKDIFATLKIRYYGMIYLHQ